MRRLVNGVVREFPERPGNVVSASEIRESSNIPEDRALIVKRPDGQNEVIGDGEAIEIPVDAEIVDSPHIERG